MRYIDYHPIKEYGINVIYGGHYATEVWGLKALMDHIQKKFNIDCEFLDLKEIEWKT
ncbi:MAG: Nif3-like dinuclear metal center hexameric protein, partial [Methanomicrobia archaeon]|nr:Nif3-like dinuclear metal center hexameric protein [Methanomicrobia archaeon]